MFNLHHDHPHMPKQDGKPHISIDHRTTPMYQSENTVKTLRKHTVRKGQTQANIPGTISKKHTKT